MRHVAYKQFRKQQHERNRQSVQVKFLSHVADKTRSLLSVTEFCARLNSTLSTWRICQLIVRKQPPLAPLSHQELNRK